MKFYFHIGHHKTGTTSLQAFLSLNAAKLLRHGIHYPWMETEGAAIAVANARAGSWFQESRLGRRLRRAQEHDRTGKSAGIPPINVREAHNALAFRMLHESLGWKVPDYHRNLPHSRQMLIGLKHQIAQLQPKHLIFCSEVMSQFGPSAPGEIGRLRDAVEGGDITLWCTLRRPDEQAESWHGQMVRFGQSPRPLSAPDGINLNWLHFNYRRVIEPWIEAMPDCRQMLRPYRRTMIEGGSVEDFVRNSGIDFPPGLAPAPKMNVSLPPGVIGLLREANRHLPADQARAFTREAATLSKGMKLASSREVEMIGAANRNRMYEAFAAIDEWLSRTTGQAAFFEDLDKMLAVKPIPEAEAIGEALDRLRPLAKEFSEGPQRDFLAGRIALSGDDAATRVEPTAKVGKG